VPEQPHANGKTLRNGRYAITGVLGAGSQGETFEALDKRDGRLVALKRFQVRGARSWKDVELAEREAKVLASLEHRLLPSFIEHFEENGALYLAMEKIEGQTLRERSADASIPQADVLRFLYDAAEVLDYLHARTPPVIHRDIKPGNVIRREREDGDAEMVLVDFGSVRANLAPKGGSTVVGTFGYMAPEQFQGRARPASDVYGAGVTALWLLTGIEPEALPHRGLAIDVPAVLANLKLRPHRNAWQHVLNAMVEPDPDRRASRIGPLLASLGPRPGGRVDAPSRGPAADQPRRRSRHRNHRSRHDRHDRHDRQHRSGRQPSQRRRRRSSAHPGSSSPPPPIIAAILVIGLAIARLGVALALGLVTPVVLTILSILFGRSLLRAAKRVRYAGRRARQSLLNAQARVSGSATPPAPHVRIGTGEQAPRPRIDESLAEAEQETEAELDAALHDVGSAFNSIEHQLRRKIR